jgi:hypothetical protein
MMDSANEIPPDVLRFLEENIDTVAQLETVLMMSETQDRSWLIADVAARNYVNEQRAAETLNALQRRGLVSCDESRSRFRFDPVTDEARALVADLARCYRRNLSRVTELIHAKASVSIKEFARAFDLKKER